MYLAESTEDRMFAFRFDPGKQKVALMVSRKKKGHKKKTKLQTHYFELVEARDLSKAMGLAIDEAEAAAKKGGEQHG